MKKTLVALAIAGVLAPVAQAADSVSIYGRIDTSVDYTKVQDGGHNKGLSNNYSRFGLKGEENLGNGLAAEFQIENAIDSTGGVAGQLDRRDTYVGIKSDSIGKVRLGLMNTPTFQLFLGTAGYGDETTRAGYTDGTTTGTTRHLSGIVDLGERISQSAYYRTPDIAGMGFADIQVSKGDVTSSGTTVNPLARRVVDGRIQYGLDGSPLVVGLGIRSAKEVNTDDNNNIYLLAGKYKYNNLFSLGAAYERDDYKAGNAGGFGYATAVASANTKVDKGFITGQYNLNQSAALVGSIGYAGNVKINGTSLDQSGGRQYTLGAQYDLSNRTRVYGFYTKLDNKDNAQYSIIDNAPTGKDNDAFVLGLRHVF